MKVGNSFIQNVIQAQQSQNQTKVQQTTNNNFAEIFQQAIANSQNTEENMSYISANQFYQYNPTFTYTQPMSTLQTQLSEQLSKLTQAPSTNTDAIRSLSSPSASRAEIENIIQKAANKHGVDPALIKAIITQESGFNPKAVSHAGASGLMQLMPKTARGLGITNPFDPEQNVEAGTKYIKSLLNNYNGNLTMALAAYNAGPGNVAKYGGVPPFQETQNYVKKVTAYYNQLK